MCGIVGYIGKKNAVPILIDGLKRLEYRGYDSAGIAVVSQGHVEVKKAMGKLANLEKRLNEGTPEGGVGIGHTRWATHGRPSDLNAHPHSDCRQMITLVHNGIIENYLEIKEKLAAEGHRFISDTDTEVLVHLIEKLYRGVLEEAVLDALDMVKGSYALAIISAHEPEKIVVARKESPLVVGVGKGEYFIGSDIPAFLAHTREVILINDREVGVITPSGVRLIACEGRREMDRKSFLVLWDSAMAEKGGYKHFMLKEIYEQPNALRQTLKGTYQNGRIVLEDANLTDEVIGQIKKICIVACGTAYHSGLVGKYILEDLVRIPVEIDVASEYRYRNPIVSEGTLFIAISQSGETADTLAAVKEAGRKGARLLAVTNVVGSSITREVQGVIFTRSGLEIGVAATKTFTAQVLVMYLLAHYLAQQKGMLGGEQIADAMAKLETVPGLIEKILQDKRRIKLLASKFQRCRDFLYLGRYINCPVALEGALKLKEISYIHAEAYAAGEMKHGPIALIDRDCPTVVVLTKNMVHDKILSNVKEVAARDGIIIGVATEGDDSVREYLDHVLYVPDVEPIFSPLLSIVPLQLLAYYMAERKGCDVDKPRNLAKSVTVE